MSLSGLQNVCRNVCEFYTLHNGVDLHGYVAELCSAPFFFNTRMTPANYNIIRLDSVGLTETNSGWEIHITVLGSAAHHQHGNISVTHHPRGIGAD